MICGCEFMTFGFVEHTRPACPVGWLARQFPPEKSAGRRFWIRGPRVLPIPSSIFHGMLLKRINDNHPRQIPGFPKFDPSGPVGGQDGFDELGPFDGDHVFLL